MVRKLARPECLLVSLEAEAGDCGLSMDIGTGAGTAHLVNFSHSCSNDNRLPNGIDYISVRDHDG